MARSEAEGIFPINNTHSFTAKGSKSIKCRDYDLLVLITAISDLRDGLNIPNEVRVI